MILDQVFGNTGKMFNHVLRGFAGEESWKRHQRDRNENQEPGCPYFLTLSQESVNQESRAKWNTDDRDMIENDMKVCGIHVCAMQRAQACGKVVLAGCVREASWRGSRRQNSVHSLSERINFNSPP